VTDARNAYLRATEMGNKDIRTFVQWILVEFDDSEWTAAIKVAQLGLDARKGNNELLYWLGSCQSRLARSLVQQDQRGRAEDEFNKARISLRKALRNAEHLEDYRQRRLNSRIYRSLILVDEQIYYLMDRRESSIRVSGLVTRMKTTLDNWGAEHPDDKNYDSESERLQHSITGLS
jgi:hypothetical protein